mmetsp:Transcript_100145/g.258731  ORF Transcript_100145/g.258731 Transcript_100145/m.258731 type:complete len:291 (+) Transcript_100145:967-1839(+)
MLWAFTSRWKVTDEMCSKAGASCTSNSRPKIQASSICLFSRRGERSAPSICCCRFRRKPSSGSPCKRVIASRMRQVSAAICCVSQATSDGSLPSQASAAPSVRPLPWPGPLVSVRSRWPSKSALRRSACELQTISLMASAVPSSCRAAQTAPKLPMPSGRPTRQQQWPMRKFTPSCSSTVAAGSATSTEARGVAGRAVACGDAAPAASAHMGCGCGAGERSSADRDEERCTNAGPGCPTTCVTHADGCGDGLRYRCTTAGERHRAGGVLQAAATSAGARPDSCCCGTVPK